MFQDLSVTVLYSTLVWPFIVKNLRSEDPWGSPNLLNRKTRSSTGRLRVFLDGILDSSWRVEVSVGKLKTKRWSRLCRYQYRLLVVIPFSFFPELSFRALISPTVFIEKGLTTTRVSRRFIRVYKSCLKVWRGYTNIYDFKSSTLCTINPKEFDKLTPWGSENKHTLWIMVEDLDHKVPNIKPFTPCL